MICEHSGNAAINKSDEETDEWDDKSESNIYLKGNKVDKERWLP